MLHRLATAIFGPQVMEGTCILAILLLLALSWKLRRQARLQEAERRCERRIREELEAYAQLDASLTQSLNSGLNVMDSKRALARRVCKTVAEKSVFTRVTMLLRDAEGRFACMGSVGTDDLTLAALHEWGEGVVADERAGRMSVAARAGTQAHAAKSFQIALGEWEKFQPELASWRLAGKKERRRWRRGVIAPIRGQNGSMAGAIAVCADGPELDGVGLETGWTAGLTRAMGPIEALAARLAVATDNEGLTERLLRAEKLAGLGQLAGGVAHALNNPLTAVLGFAELIAETTGDPRVKQDAETILAEALKMKETVSRLVEFWRPSSGSDETVDLLLILNDLAGKCTRQLTQRGVALEVSAGDQVPPVRGNSARLRQVIEHLLNNAAQAIATASPREEVAGGHAIRIAISSDERAVKLVVSDSGPGFREPGKVFDPFYTTKGPEEGSAGMGLSICYGIVREHEGEITAFNLHPHGAAVVVELPLRKVVQAQDSPVVRESPVWSRGVQRQAS